MTNYVDSKRGRGEAFLATLNENENARYNQASQNIRLEMAKMYGDRLSEIVVANALLESAMHFDLIPFIHGDSEPVNWRNVTEDIVTKDELIQLNLAHSDKKQKAQIREQSLEALQPAQRMSMQRDGSLESYLNKAVSEQLSI